jgi:hypothetical protein
MRGKRAQPLWTAAEIARLHTDFLRGVSYKSMAHTLGRTDAQVRYQIEIERAKDPEGWPARKQKGVRTTNFLYVFVDEGTRQRVSGRAHQRGMSISGYVRNLILRDLGAA